jgi:putative membrane protein
MKISMSPVKLLFLGFSLAVLLWSAVSPKDVFTWFLEVFPVLIGLPLLIWAELKWRISTPLFMIICLHCMILCTGGHYTYAEVPLGFWFRDFFHFSRNHFDRLGHFFQGITPALVVHTFLKRKTVVTSAFWLKVLSASAALSFSALYELFEWLTAVLTHEAATAFLGTQGDPWDTQWDMFMALCGALSAMILVSMRENKKSRLTQYTIS